MPARRTKQRAARVARRRLILLASLGVLVVVVVVGAWLGFRSWQAVRQLRTARAAAASVQADLRSGAPVASALSAFQSSASAAFHDTHDPVWALTAWLPPVHTVRGLTGAVNSMAEQVLPPVADVASSVSPNTLRVNGHTINVAALARAAHPLARASAAMTGVAIDVNGLPSGWIGPLTTARDELALQTVQLAGSLADAAAAARIGPEMLGAKSTTRYFVGVQNNAESRGTGGLLGGWVEIVARHGSLSVAAKGTDGSLRDPKHAITDLSAGFKSVYGLYGAARDWRDSNLSPDFPEVGSLWTQLWTAETGQHIQGAIAVDPELLADLLSQTGPVTDEKTATTISSANAVSLLESTEYSKFSIAQTNERKQFLVDVASAVIDKLLSGAGSATGVVSALGDAAGAGHLQIYSTFASAERVLMGSPLAGALPRTKAPFGSLTVDNASGTKLDYYLQRGFDYSQVGCSAGQRLTTLTATLTNSAPSTGLAPYVQTETIGGAIKVEAHPVNKLLIFLDATAGSHVLRVTVDGQAEPVRIGVADGGHVVISLDLALRPGQTRTITAFLSEPDQSGVALTKIQPLASPQATVVSVPGCPA